MNDDGIGECDVEDYDIIAPQGMHLLIVKFVNFSMNNRIQLILQKCSYGRGQFLLNNFNIDWGDGGL